MNLNITAMLALYNPLNCLIKTHLTYTVLNCTLQCNRLWKTLRVKLQHCYQLFSWRQSSHVEGVEADVTERDDKWQLLSITTESTITLVSRVSENREHPQLSSCGAWRRRHVSVCARLRRPLCCQDICWAFSASARPRLGVKLHPWSASVL